MKIIKQTTEPTVIVEATYRSSRIAMYFDDTVCVKERPSPTIMLFH